MGGLGLFLYGIQLMREGLGNLAGKRLESVLRQMTANSFSSLFVGVIITMILQSSSATTVLVIGLVDAGLMTLVKACFVMMGANVGTTATGLLLAFKTTDYMPILVLIGVFLMFSKKKKIKETGQMVSGLGILFMGMWVMSSAMSHLANLPTIHQFLLIIFQDTKNPLWGILVGTLIAGIMQSSTALIAILISMGRMGILELDSAIYILYGSNIGTCVTAFLASMRASRVAKQAAMIHLLFNLIGSFLFALITMPPFSLADWIRQITGDVAGQLAWTHILFNIGTTLFLFPFAKYLVHSAKSLIPD